MNIMKVFFDELDTQGIKYLHFKSNMNLSLSFQAKGDFDVLVEKERLADIEKTITECGGKRFNKPYYGVYPGVDNWLIFDKENGCIYHLHLHYQLASGKKLLKEYVIPWNEVLFESRIKDSQFDIYISSPEAELLLLAVRTVIKAHQSDYFRAFLGLYKTHSSLFEEHKDLVQRVKTEKVRELGAKLFSQSDIESIVQIVMKPNWKSSDFRTISKLVRKEFAHNRRFSPFVSSFKSGLLSLGDKYNKFLRRVVGKRRIENKVSLSGGRIIAFVGVDGAGKSTTKDQIYKWMKPQIECRRFYMGTGDGKVNRFASIAKKMASISNCSSNSTNSQASSQPASLRTNPRKYLRKVFGALMVYSVEKSNYKKVITMNQYRIEGGTSLLDRYPQIEAEGQNDGSKIISYRHQVTRSKLLDYLCKKEMLLLDIVREIKPDVVIRLNISAETSMKRKPEHQDITFIQEKIDQLNKITFQNAKIIDINAEHAYDEELLCIKKIIWELL